MFSGCAEKSVEKVNFKGYNRIYLYVLLKNAERVITMPLTKIELNNITVFHELSVEFNNGINVFLGENGVGKTHIMKLLYAACQAKKSEVTFPYKTVMVFRPDNSSIGRLVNRDVNSENRASVKVSSNDANIAMKFSHKSQKYDAEVTGKAAWEKQMVDLSSVFIPAKEILSNAWNLSNAVRQGNIIFDDTYLDIIAAAEVNVASGNDSSRKKKYLDELKKISKGTVTVQQEHFYLKPGNQARLEFNLVAEGLRKIALLWQLIKNGTLEKGAVLFWDEPEANINPKFIPEIVKILLMLQEDGVQVFISTHDYFLAKYFDVLKGNKDAVHYYSFYKTTEETGREQICVEQASSFKLLEHNTIMETFRKLYEDEIGVSFK